MKVAINTLVTPADNKIGVGVYIDNLVNELIQQFPQHEFYAFVNKKKPAVRYQANNYHAIEFLANPQPSALLGLWQPAFAHRLKAINADVYHLPNTAPLLFNTCPSVATIFDLQEFKIQKYGLFRTAYRRLTNLMTSKFADLILTISNNSKEDIVNFLGVDPAKVRVAYLAHADCFQMLDKMKAVAYVREKFGYHNYFITVGDIQPGKNLIRLLHVYARLRRHNEQYTLVLVGKERQMYSKLHETIENLHLQEVVKFAGYVSQEDLIYLYNASYMCIYPSLYEGFGLPILEAMACGTPVVASNVSSIPEVAGGAAVFFNPYDIEEMEYKIKSLLDDPKRVQFLINEGQKQAQKFSWQRTAIETMEAYESVVGSIKYKDNRV